MVHIGIIQPQAQASCSGRHLFLADKGEFNSLTINSRPFNIHRGSGANTTNYRAAILHIIFLTAMRPLID
jgi:hypothetical protein